MARKIIVLEQAPSSDDYRIAFWLDVPAPRQRFYAKATATSAFLDATVEEIAAIQSGAVVEFVERFNRPFGTSLAVLRADLIARHAELQDSVTTENPWNRYGSSYDGSSWTAVSVG